MAEPAQALSTARVLVVLVVAELVSGVESSMLYTAVATLYRIYGDPVGVGWIITSFLLVSAAAAAVCGRLGDLYGRRRLLIAMLALSAVGSMISAVATSLEVVIMGRAVQGAAAAILPLCYGLAKEHLPTQRVSLGIGVVAGTASLSAGIGYLLGGMVVDRMPWQALFQITTVLALVAIVVVVIGLPRDKPRARRSRIDLLGGVLFVPAITGLLFAVTRSRDWGWQDARTLSLLVGSVLLLAYWARYESRHPEPLIDVRLLAQRQIALANIGFALVALGAIQSAQVLLTLMQQPIWTLVGLGASATLAGLLKAPASVLGSFAAVASGHLSSKRGGRVAMLIGTLVMAISWAVLTIEHSTVWGVALGAAVVLMSTSVIYAAVPSLIVEVAPADRVSEATGLSAVVRAAFGAVGSQAIAIMLASSTMSNPARGAGVFPTEQAYGWVFASATACSLLAFVVAWYLPRRRPSKVVGSESMVAVAPRTASAH